MTTPASVPLYPDSLLSICARFGGVFILGGATSPLQSACRRELMAEAAMRFGNSLLGLKKRLIQCATLAPISRQVMSASMELRSATAAEQSSAVVGEDSTASQGSLRGRTIVHCCHRMAHPPSVVLGNVNVAAYWLLETGIFILHMTNDIYRIVTAENVSWRQIV